MCASSLAHNVSSITRRAPVFVSAQQGAWSSTPVDETALEMPNGECLAARTPTLTPTLTLTLALTLLVALTLTLTLTLTLAPTLLVALTLPLALILPLALTLPLALRRLPAARALPLPRVEEELGRALLCRGRRPLPHRAAPPRGYALLPRLPHHRRRHLAAHNTAVVLVYERA